MLFSTEEGKQADRTRRSKTRPYRRTVAASTAAIATLLPIPYAAAQSLGRAGRQVERAPLAAGMVLVRRALAWTFVGQLLSFAATFGTTVALARILSPREIGIYAIGLAVSGVLQALSAFGIATFVVRERELTPRVLETAFTVNAIVSALLALILFACSFLGQVTTGEPMVASVLRLLAIVPLLGAVEFRPGTMLQREMEFRTISIVTVARTVAIAVVSIAAALMGASALSSAYGAIAGGVVGALGFSLAARHHTGFRLRLEGWRAMSAFGFKTLAIGGIAVLVARASDLILGAILGLTLLGFYNRANALAGVAIANVYAAIARVLFVKLADDDRAGRDVGASYARSLDMILALMWPLLAGAAVLAGPIVAVLFGQRWLPMAAPFAVIAIAQGVGLAYAMNYELYVLRDEVGRQTRLESIRALAALVAFVAGCSFGIVGASFGRLADTVVGGLLYLPELLRLTSLRRARLLALYGRNAAVTAASVLPSLLVMLVSRWSPDVSRGVLAFCIVAGGAGWLASLRLLRHPLWNELLNQAEALLARRRRHREARP